MFYFKFQLLVKFFEKKKMYTFFFSECSGKYYDIILEFFYQKVKHLFRIANKYITRNIVLGVRMIPPAKYAKKPEQRSREEHQKQGINYVRRWKTMLEPWKQRQNQNKCKRKKNIRIERKRIGKKTIKLEKKTQQGKNVKIKKTYQG